MSKLGKNKRSFKKSGCSFSRFFYPPMNKKNTEYRLVIPLLLLIAFVSYFNIFTGNFVWDDHCLIVNNPLIRDWRNLSEIFSCELHRNSSTNYYRPMQVISYMVDYYFFKLNPAGYHAVNVLLHFFACLLLFFLLRRLTGRFFLSAAVVFLFLVHPIHTNAVSYISGRADLLAAIFIFSSLIFFLKSFCCVPRQGRLSQNGHFGYYAMSLFLFILALFTKETVIVFPFVVWGADMFVHSRLRNARLHCRQGRDGVCRLSIPPPACRQGRQETIGGFSASGGSPRSFILKRGNRFKRVLFFFLADFIYMAARFTFLNFSSGNPFFCKKGFAVFDVGFFQRCGIFLKTLVIYIGSLFIPAGLHMERVIAAEHIGIFHYAGFLLCILICLSVIQKSILKKGRFKNLFMFALFWFFIWLLPQSAFFLPKIMADHFLYFPSIGIFLIIAMFLDMIRKKNFIRLRSRPVEEREKYALVRHGQRLWGSMLIMCCIYFCSFTWFYNQKWKSEFSFFLWTARHSPSSYKVHDCLADLYLKMGRLDEAIHEYELILNQYRGVIPREGVDFFVYEPKNGGNLDKKQAIISRVFYNLGVVYAQQGRFKQAMNAYFLALELDPDSEQAYNNLGLIYERAGDFEKAEQMYNKAIMLDAAYVQPYNNLAVLYLQKGDLNKAIKFWSDVLKIKPDYEIAKKNIALAHEIFLNKIKK